MLIAKSKNGWELHTIANGKLSCENFNIESSEENAEVEHWIQQKFGDILNKEGIFVGWDNWSGTYIMQMPGKNTESSDKIIREIYEFLADSNLHNSVFVDRWSYIKPSFKPSEDGK